MKGTRIALIDFASLVGSGVASRIAVTGLSPECHRTRSLRTNLEGKANFGEYRVACRGLPDRHLDR
jgi:hypothetical protein